ncbi:MAG: methionine ABC transporter ATP-binding protein [Propionibacteriales bacterium]|nr:methionine ABC transporter ATP-binding protein [Propionibacteriales bacterium]
MIEVSGVSKIYPGGVAALDDVSLRVAAGEIYGIIGRSGAGKTTLLRCLNLLETPTTGEIWLDGTALAALSGARLRQVRRDIGVVFQQFNLLDSRTVRGNIAFPLEVAGVPRAERERRVDELLDLVGLTERQRAHPGQLSGGQKQRVGIARALAANPKVLLCDEPTSALDSETTTQVLELLSELNRQLGVTIVIITHELSVVRAICQSGALLDGGKVADSGRLVDLVTRPDSRLGEALLPTSVPASTGPQERASALVTFADAGANGHLFSQLTRELGIDVSLLGGGVERIGSTDVGRLRVAFSSADGMVDVPRVRHFLADRGAQVAA